MRFVGIAAGAAAAAAAVGTATWFVFLRSEPHSERTATANAQSAEPLPAVSSPARSKLQRAGAFTIPAVPASLQSPPSLTLDVTISAANSGRPRVLQRKTITRAGDRVHIAFAESGPEWLFLRNAADGRRVSGTLIEHRRQSLVEYDESEIRNAGLGRGWADIVSVGVEPETLERLKPTGKAETVAGFSFLERRDAEATKGGVRAVWWSDEAAVPLRIHIGEGASAREIVASAIRPSVAQELLSDPRERFPGYAVIDVADYREKHHEHGVPGVEHPSHAHP